MSTEIKHRRGTSAQHASFTGALAEITIDTDKKTAVVHDGATPGGNPLLDKAAYDPNNRRLDVFDMDSMQDGADKVAMTVLERARFQTIKTPYDYGADPSDAITVDQTAAVQALLDAVRASWSNDVNNFTLIADLAGRMWEATGIDWTELRQPGMILQNGGLYGTGAGKILLDVAGTNSPILRDLILIGNKASQPAVGILLSRAKIGGTMVAVPNARFFNVQTSGYWSKAARISIAAEVTSEYGCWWRNYSRSLTAYSYINVGHAKTLDDYIGGLTSDYTTLPVAADGAMSNILHYMGQPHILREADLALPVTSITKANPAVVTVNSAALTAAGLSNGEKVYFHQVVGMTQLNGNVYTVANVNLGAGTFELSGTNSTSFGTFISGYVWNQTGPAMLLNGVEGMTGHSGYMLTYGQTGIVVDTINGVPPREIHLEFSHEAQPPSTMRIDKASSGTVVWQGLRLLNMSSQQNYSDTVIDDTGAGTVRFDGLELTISNMGVAPPNKVFKNPTRIILRNAKVVMPLTAALNDYADFTVVPQGEFTAYDRTPQTHNLGESFFGVQDFYAGATLAPALRAILSDDGPASGPFIDIIRRSATPAASDGGGAVRFIESDSALNDQVMATLRARTAIATDGGEYGRLEVVLAVDGVDTLEWFFQSAGIYDGVNKVLGKRVTGFSTATGAANKDASGINVDTITATDANIRALAAWVKALHDALAPASGHGLIN